MPVFLQSRSQFFFSQNKESIANFYALNLQAKNQKKVIFNLGGINNILCLSHLERCNFKIKKNTAIS